MSLSEWKDIWKEQVVDFLIHQHSPRTRQTLLQLGSSQMLRNLTDVGGPYRRTRARRNILELNGAGPSGTSGEVDVEQE